MPTTECLAIQDTVTGLWLISVNSDGTYSWGNAGDAVCFPTEDARQAVLTALGDSNRFVGHVPPKKPH